LNSTVAKLFQKPSTAIGTALTLLFLCIALIGPWVSPYSATETSSSIRSAPSWEHWFGTDHLGRDVFSRVLIGTQSILLLAGVGTLLAVLIGTFLGLLSGYWGRWFDEILMRFFDSLLAIPAMLFALLLLGVIEAASVGTSRSFLSNLSVLFVIAIVYIPIVARVVRSEVLSLKEKGFVEAARLRGESLFFILFREILPSVLPALSVEAALRFSYAIFLVASLGFLGIGVQPPTPNWGLMVNEARIFVSLAPWSLYFPVAAIAVLVISVNLMADGLKNALQSSVEILPQRLFQSSQRQQTSASSKNNTIVELQNITVSYTQGKQILDAVRDVSLNIEPGQIYGLVGESGSGKSTLALAMMRYLSANGSLSQGEIYFSGQSIWTLDEKNLKEIWGSQMSLVPQNPMASLNPSLRIGEQMIESLNQKEHSHQEAIDKTLTWLGKVNIPDPERVVRSYPHQLSGGMQQRVLIAMALSNNPKFVILDEPTTGLDVTTEAVILDLLRDLIREQQTAALYISHDLGVVSQISDRVAVLYAGELVEDADVESLYQQPVHPYTMGLLNSVPKLGQSKRKVTLHSMQGQIPSLQNLPSGCVFAPRCPLVVDQCVKQRPELETLNMGKSSRNIRCHRWQDIISDQTEMTSSEQTKLEQTEPPTPAKKLLEVAHLKKQFQLPRPLKDLLKRQPAGSVKAVDDVNFNLDQGRTLGLVGESGSGKTTLARAIAGLTPANEGHIKLDESVLAPKLSQRSKETLKKLQLVSQQPEEALNPFMTIGQSLKRPLKKLIKSPDIQVDLKELLNQVGLDEGYIIRLPSQLSGGEKQRVTIARAFAADPALIICDEPTSALDVSVQARILNLLSRLQQEKQTSYLFITHDLAAISYLADDIAVIYLGELMESGPASAVFEPPYHPYTEALLSAVPRADHQTQSQEIRLEGDIPSPTQKPSGCPFHTRCPRFLGNICVEQTPPWQADEQGHGVYCHIPKDELKQMQSSLIQREVEG